MKEAGFFQTILFFLIVIAIIGLMSISINKFYKSKIPFNRKILWIIFFILTPLFGLMIFYFYHENYLSQDLRANANS
jgi:hypothetical protein